MPSVTRDDAPSFSEYRADNRGVEVLLLYLGIIVHSFAFATATFVRSESQSMPDWGIILVGGALLFVLLAVPIALWRDRRRVEDQLGWEPRWYLFGICSFGIGVVAVFALMFYAMRRKDAVRDAYIDEYAVWTDVEAEAESDRDEESRDD